ncbi:small integral membrane protein 5 isoform X1 [Pan troglodytes]|nr:small integral membrane protein 5 isoform X1 [Pan troglodytes]
MTLSTAAACCCWELTLFPAGGRGPPGMSLQFSHFAAPGGGWPELLSNKPHFSCTSKFSLSPTFFLPVLSPAEAPTGSRRGMAATDFVQEMRAVGERLLLKLQRLPQAEPVEIVAFSVIILFTATVLLLLLIACSCCCTHSCCPERRGRKVQVQPTPP